MEARMLGWIQIVGAAVALYFDRAVFSVPSGPTIAIAVLSVLFVIVGLHHLAEKPKKKH